MKNPFKSNKDEEQDEKQEAEQEQKRLEQEAKESAELLKIYKGQEESRKKIKELDKYKDDHKPVKKQGKFMSKLVDGFLKTGKVIRKLQIAAGKLEMAQPSKLDAFGNPKKKSKKKGSLFISTILILIIAVVFLSGCSPIDDKYIKLNDTCISNIKSSFCENKGGIIIYDQVNFRVLCSINFEEKQFRLDGERFFVCEVPKAIYNSFWERFDKDKSCSTCSYYLRVNEG